MKRNLIRIGAGLLAAAFLAVGAAAAETALPADAKLAEPIPVIPEGTRLLGISISDNICYVNLSQEFLNKIPGLTDEAVVYSVVNSLVEGTGAIQVQIAVAVSPPMKPFTLRSARWPVALHSATPASRPSPGTRSIGSISRCPCCRL